MSLIPRGAGLTLLALFGGTAFAQSDKPNPAVTPAHRNADAGWKKRHEGFLEKYKNGGVDVLFVGDSITHSWEGQKKIWDENFQDWKPGNIGISGDRTEHVLWRITEGKEFENLDPKIFVMMIGTNNISAGHTPEQIAAGIAAIVDEMKKQKPKAKVLILGVFPRAAGSTKGKESIPADELQPKVGKINALAAKLDDGKAVHYLDIGKSFLEDDGGLSKKIMPDYLHLSADGYRKWAAAIKEPVEKLLK